MKGRTLRLLIYGALLGIPSARCMELRNALIPPLRPVPCATLTAKEYKEYLLKKTNSRGTVS